MKMKHVPETSDIPSFADAVGLDAVEVRHQLDVVARASGFTEHEARDLDAFVAAEGWGGDDDHDDERGSTAGDEEEGSTVSDEEGVKQEGEACSDREASECEEEEDGDDDREEETDQGDAEGEARKERVRRVKVPQSITKRVHDVVHRQRKAAGASGGGKSSRNHQKRKEKGNILYKHRDF